MRTKEDDYTFALWGSQRKTKFEKIQLGLIERGNKLIGRSRLNWLIRSLFRLK